MKEKLKRVFRGFSGSIRKKKVARLIFGLVLFYFLLMLISTFFDTYKLKFQSPVIIQLPVIVQHRNPPGQFLIKKAHAEALVHPAPSATPTPTDTPQIQSYTAPVVVMQAAPQPTAQATPTPTTSSAQGDPHNIAQAMFSQAFGADQWPAAEALINSESGFNPVVYNQSSGACGLGQALPCGKMGCNLSYSTEDIRCEIRWMIGYVRGTHGGTPESNWAFHLANGWY